MESLAVAHDRCVRLGQGMLKPLTSTVSQAAADELYIEAARKLMDGLERKLEAGAESQSPQERTAARLWKQTAPEPR